MSEKAEWELVDSPQSRHEGNGYHHGSQGTAHQNEGQTPAHFLQALLGRWWQLKLLGAGLVAVIAFALLIMIGGVLVLTLSAAALMSFGIAKLASWLRGKQLGQKTQLASDNRNPWQP